VSRVHLGTVAAVVLVLLVAGYIKLAEFGWRKRAEILTAQRLQREAEARRFYVLQGLADDDDDAADMLGHAPPAVAP
jgi:hypothetical protein